MQVSTKITGTYTYFCFSMNEDTILDHCILTSLYNDDDHYYSCIAIGTDSSFKVFTVEPFRKCFEHGMCLVKGI